MGQSNADKAAELLAQLVHDSWPEDRRAAAVAAAILALADEVRNLAAEVEKAGWAVGEKR